MSGYLGRSVVGRSTSYAWRWLGPVRKRLLLSPVLAMLLTGAETLVLLVAARLLLAFVEEEDELDIGVAGIDSLSFYEACLIGLALTVIAAGLRYAYSRYTASLVGVAVRTARESLLDSALHMPWQRQRSQRLGELQRLLGTNGTATSVPILVMATVLNAGSAIVVYFAIVAWTAPQLLIIVAGIILGLLVIFAPLRKMLTARARAHTAAIAELQLDSTSFSSLKREIELYAVQDESFSQLRRSNYSLASAFRQQMFLQRLIPPLYQLALMAGVVAAVAFAKLVGLTLVGVGTAAVLLLRSLSYVQQLNTNVQNAIAALPLMQEIDEYVAEARSFKRSFGDEELTTVTEIELRNVSFEYETSTSALEHVDLTLHAGDRIGIIGSSGGGKSTLANLLVRLTDSTLGSILVNGRPIAAYDPQSWANEVGYVGQDPLLLRGTIEENVRLFRTASIDDVERSLANANILREVQALPEGLQTAVGEGSNSLSGGQRQRLGIARALLTKPSLVVLDEPSSALDAESEQQIGAALDNLDPSTILVVISHRPLLLEACTRVVRIDDGRVVEDRSKAPAAPVA